MKKVLLKEVLSVQSVSGKEKEMIKYIKDYCKHNNYKCVVKKNNLYVTKGDAEIYPCFVAHTDTVHSISGKITDRLSIHESNGNLFAMGKDCQQVGIGGDDKVGIYIALRMLDRLPKCKAAFFHSEEIGCVGSNDADIAFFSDCSFALQADRRGNTDWVTSIGGADISSKEFQKDIKPIISNYKYKFSGGAMTDVEALIKKGIGISCANVSCGYYRPHTSSEYVSVADVSVVEEMFYKIAVSLSSKRYEHEHKPTDYGYYGAYTNYYGTRYTKPDHYNYNESGSDLFSQENSYQHNEDWFKHKDYGWMKLSKMYCKVCIDNQLHERVGNHYFQFVCNDCGTLHESTDALTFENAMEYLYNETING